MKIATEIAFLRGFLVAYALIEYTTVFFMVLGYISMPQTVFIIPISLIAGAGTLAVLAQRLLKQGRLRAARITTLLAGLLGVGFPSTAPAVYLVYRALRKKHWLVAKQ